jgi:hypothetical protein
MGIKVVMLPNGMLRGKPHQPDGQHLTLEGYHMLAEELAGQVAGALSVLRRRARPLHLASLFSLSFATAT